MVAGAISSPNGAGRMSVCRVAGDNDNANDFVDDVDANDADDGKDDSDDAVDNSEGGTGP